MRTAGFRLVVTCGVLALLPINVPLCAQELVVAPPPAPPAPPPATDTDSGFSGRNSNVGYIDSTLPLSQFRLRYDAAYNNNRPTRAEYFYAKGRGIGPGLREPESQVDYQDVSAYLEVTARPRLSVFAEVPVRFLNPELNANHAGLADMNGGFKYAFVRTDDLIATFQLRAYAPTGNAHLGLGTRHVSLEPALLLYAPLSHRLTFEGELRYWAPIGGTDFAGDVIRYGAGLSYNLFENDRMRVSPVAEVVGWTVLGGKESVFNAAMPNKMLMRDAAGDTIVNLKLGVRTRLGENADFYVGWGRPLTGEHWYKDVLRLELRWLF